jgi:hypothetical protein
VNLLHVPPDAAQDRINSKETPDGNAACNASLGLRLPRRVRRGALGGCSGISQWGRHRYIGTLYRDEAARLYKAPGYSPYAGRNYPTRVLWGDTHLHTANSLDAAAFGNTLGPEPAYRFARGEEVVSSTGQPVKLSRPLDFLVVADHAEALGATEQTPRRSAERCRPIHRSDSAI